MTVAPPFWLDSSWSVAVKNKTFAEFESYRAVRIYWSYIESFHRFFRAGYANNGRSIFDVPRSQTEEISRLGLWPHSPRLLK
jgi:hypothetical protein